MPPERRGPLALALAILGVAAGCEGAETGRCADYNALRNLYTGDLHVHTALSLDAATQDTRARPRDAYRFARGEPLGLQPFDANGTALRQVRIRWPLDFAAVTDHAELLGEVALCQQPGSGAFTSWQCGLYRNFPRSAYYLFNYTASTAARLGMCGVDGNLCREAALGPWQEIIEAAEQANDACRFTALIGYEWTGAAGVGENLHRNVIFGTEAVPRLPIDFIETVQPERLWDELDRACAQHPGCEWLAIPHNANLSAGAMFRPERPGGAPYTRAAAERRAHAEPLLEIMQHKGASECFAGGGAVHADEYCDFEQLPYDSFAGQNFAWQRQAPVRETGFLRDVLREGLRVERRTGADPFRLGVIGSTDTHIGAAGLAGETDFPGHGGAGEPAREGMPPGLVDRPEFGPGGLAMVWAEQNSRAAIFAALRRRETYATSGTRPELRFFGGWDFPDDMCSDRELVAHAYAAGVPMGGELHRDDASAAKPVFVAAARRDAIEGGLLQQLQIVKGWINADGSAGERVLTAAGDPHNGAGVDPLDCTPRGPGADQLCAVWRDTDWRADESAWYYTRLLEILLPLERARMRRAWRALRRCIHDRTGLRVLLRRRASPGDPGTGLELADLDRRTARACRAMSLAQRLRRLARSKPLHFVFGGILLYVLIGGSTQREVQIEQVALGPEARSRLLAGWAAELGREPSPAEAAALLQRELDDEVLFREALALGVDRRDPVVRARLLLDIRFLGVEGDDEKLLEQAYAMDLTRNDVVVRRRLVQVMEFALADGADRTPVSEQELAAMFVERRAELALPARWQLTQVYFSNERRGEHAVADAEAARARLERESVPARQAIAQGDPFLGGHQLPALDAAQLGAQFGEEFVRGLAQCVPRHWCGPVHSSFGAHLLWIEAYTAPSEASIDDPAVRSRLESDVLRARAERQVAQAVVELRRKYGGQGG